MSFINRNQYPVNLAKGYTIIDPVNNIIMDSITHHIKRSLNPEAITRYLEFALKNCVQRQQYEYFINQFKWFNYYGHIHLTATPLNQYELKGFY